MIVLLENKNYGIILRGKYKSTTRYLVFYRLMERLEGFLMKRVNIENITSDFINDFIIFVQNEEYRENTI
ncbi:phage integrase SAM-like domain-containing protein [Chryseobacterium nematophagum]|uniref:phage integrase SAM-like domain-containing protein n=1 Tax=Chryseobacterium nematophagum TaxID=2305228 RepID=UPI003741F555